MTDLSRYDEELSEYSWLGGDFTADDDYPPADLTGGFISLGFLRNELRRRRRLWLVTAVIGLLASCAYYAVSPAPHQATTKLLLTQGPYEDLNTAANNDEAMAMTQAVAGAAVRKLGLHETPAQFLGTYTVVPVTERVIAITVKAPSGQGAVAAANAVGTAFLAFRAQEMKAEQQQVLGALEQQVAKARQQSQDQSTLYNLRQAVLGNKTTIQPATAAAVKGSVVLDPATALPYSKVKPLIRDVATGLVSGLAIGVVIVVLAALFSDKLRRRDDIAQALEAPVRLSVPSGGGRRGRGGRGWPEDVERIAGYLRRAVPGSSRGPASLAVVSVGDTRIPSECLARVAVGLARDGRNVVLADLSPGAETAKLLGASGPGVAGVAPDGVRLTVAVPEPGEVAPAGPFGPGPALAPASPFSREAGQACARADLVLTHAVLDPASGGEHLVTWAGDAVVMVTAGKSSWATIHGTGEMVRLSGARLHSAVVTGADVTDGSLGTTYLPQTA